MQQRWRSLRDRFVRENRNKKKPTVSVPMSTPSWELLEHMIFLRCTLCSIPDELLDLQSAGITFTWPSFRSTYPVGQYKQLDAWRILQFTNPEVVVQTTGWLGNLCHFVWVSNNYSSKDSKLCCHDSIGVFNNMMSSGQTIVEYFLSLWQKPSRIRT